MRVEKSQRPVWGLMTIGKILVRIAIVQHEYLLKILLKACCDVVPYDSSIK